MLHYLLTVLRIRSRTDRHFRRPHRPVRVEVLETRQLFSGTAWSQAGAAPEWAAIINGTPTNEFASVGMVGHAFLGFGFGSGTLIDSRHVLTAAHLVKYQDGLVTEYFDKSLYFEVNGLRYETERVFIHPEYQVGNRFLDTDNTNDIAILQLKQDVKGIAPSAISRVAPQVGDQVALVGFGLYGTNRIDPKSDFGRKHVGQTRIDEVSSRRISWDFDSPSESNTAPGDSGGPAFVLSGDNYVIAGITSGGTRGDSGLGDHSFDTRVDAYAAWIDSVLAATDPATLTDTHPDSPSSRAPSIHLTAGAINNLIGAINSSTDRDTFQLIVNENGMLNVSVQGVYDQLHLRGYPETCLNWKIDLERR